jgi:hypothetical protein
MGGIFANGRMGAASGFNAQNPFFGQHASSGQKLGVFFRENVIRDDRNLHAGLQRARQGFDQGRFARAHGASDANDGDVP